MKNIIIIVAISSIMFFANSAIAKEKKEYMIDDNINTISKMKTYDLHLKEMIENEPTEKIMELILDLYWAKKCTNLVKNDIKEFVNDVAKNQYYGILVELKLYKKEKEYKSILQGYRIINCNDVNLAKKIIEQTKN